MSRVAAISPAHSIPIASRQLLTRSIRITRGSVEWKSCSPWLATGTWADDFIEESMTTTSEILFTRARSAITQVQLGMFGIGATPGPKWIYWHLVKLMQFCYEPFLWIGFTVVVCQPNGITSVTSFLLKMEAAGLARIGVTFLTSRDAYHKVQLIHHQHHRSP